MVVWTRAAVRAPRPIARTDAAAYVREMRKILPAMEIRKAAG
ncbi:hypothetical protein ACWIGW_34760 [Nocardia brasiliensis]